MYPQLENVMQFMLDKINKIKDYFIAEIRERETLCWQDFACFYL